MITTICVLGTCQILFHISGPKSQSESPNPTYIVPKQVSEMAGWIFSRCVSTGRGGFITKGLQNSISWLVDPNINFQEDIYRKYRPRFLTLFPIASKTYMHNYLIFTK